MAKLLEGREGGKCGQGGERGGGVWAEHGEDRKGREVGAGKGWGESGEGEGDGEGREVGGSEDRGQGAVEAVVQVWRDVRQRLLEPLRCAVRCFFCYMRLSEAQSAEQASVAVPLRLLRLLLK